MADKTESAPGEMTQKVESPETGAVADDGMVDVHEADRLSLDTALANAIKEEQESSDPSADDAPPTEETPAQGAEAQPAAKPESQATKSQPPAETSASKPARSPEEIQALEAENARLKKQGDQKELFIQHRGNELGTLRAQLSETKRQLEAAKAQLANGLDDRFAENPAKAIEDRDRIKEIDQQLQGITHQEDRASKIVESQTMFLRNIDTEKVSIDDIATVLEADGVPPDYVAQYKANPWEWTTPEAHVQMGKRAMDRKQFTEADKDRRTLARHVLYLNEQIKKLQAKPRQVMAQVQKNLNRPPAMTSAQSTTPKQARDLDPTKMTRQELDLALKQAMRH